MPYIEHIFLYPIKSFDGVEVIQAQLRPNGSLHHDREYMFIREKTGEPLQSLDDDDRPYRIRITFDQSLQHITLSAPTIANAPLPVTLNLSSQGDEISKWVSQALGQNVILKHDDDRGFCDDQDRAGPTLISASSLQRLAEVTDHRDMQRRMRSNIVLGNMPTYMEDQLFGAERIQLGDLTLTDALPCIRCRVPARDPETGEEDKSFRARFKQERKISFLHNPHAEAMHVANGGYYYAAMNTKAEGEQKGSIKIGDELHIISKKQSHFR